MYGTIICMVQYEKVDTTFFENYITYAKIFCCNHAIINCCLPILNNYNNDK